MVEKRVLHVAGPSGAGKSWLGRRLKRALGDRAVVQDLDLLRDSFIRQHYGERRWRYLDAAAYQRFLHAWLDRQRRPVVLVGLNDNTVYGSPAERDLYFDLRADRRYFLDVDDATVLTRKCTRLFAEIAADPVAMRDLTHDNPRFLKKMAEAIRHECSLPATVAANARWRCDYRRQRYTFLSQEKIFEIILRQI